MPSPLLHRALLAAALAVLALGVTAGAASAHDQRLVVRGSGVASLAEGAANHHRITLIGRVAAHR